MVTAYLFARDTHKNIFCSFKKMAIFFVSNQQMRRRRCKRSNHLAKSTVWPTGRPGADPTTFKSTATTPAL
jgi:hypothetical protein